MKRPPKSSHFEMTQMRRVDFLIGAFQRLQDDVGTIITLINAHNSQSILQKKRVIGFWATLRMILPIIEAISHVQNIRPEALLGNHLNINVPYLTWDLFRHSLIHGDTLQEGKYLGKNVTWGIGFGAGGHIITSGHIGIDVPTLYNDLVNYLQQEIAKNDQMFIDIETGVEYGISGAPNTNIIRDFSKL